MFGASPVPLWAVALVLAALAPFAAASLATTFEQHSRARSRRLLGLSSGDERH
jgi:hypothetical protein